MTVLVMVGHHKGEKAHSHQVTWKYVSWSKHTISWI